MGCRMAKWWTRKCRWFTVISVILLCWIICCSPFPGKKKLVNMFFTKPDERECFHFIQFLLHTRFFNTSLFISETLSWKCSVYIQQLVTTCTVKWNFKWVSSYYIKIFIYFLNTSDIMTVGFLREVIIFVWS